MKRLALTALMGLALAAPAAAADFKLIAHPSIGVGQLSREDASRLFLKKEMKWTDGTAAQPVDLPPDSGVRESFSERIHGKGVGAVDAYWQKQIFGGRKTPPVVKSSDAEVVAWVKANPGAVGYVSAGTPASGVRVIEVGN